MLNFSSINQNSSISEALQPFLQQIGMSSSVAEAHGLLSGLICSGSNNQGNDYWLNKLDLDIDQNNVMVKEAIEVIDAFYQTIKSSLDATEIEFQLAIDDNSSLNDRLSDFSLWVQSFLYGMGLNSNFDMQKCSEQVKEIVTDFVQISHADDYKLDIDTLENDEHALFELMEYVKISVILINDELNKHIDIQRITIPEGSETQLH